MELKTVFISELKPAKYNPRKDLSPGDPEYESIKRSIEEFGYVDPIIVNSDYTVIGGHQRLKVLQELGHTTVSVIIIDIDKTREKALNVALNKIVGSWDMEKLTKVLDDLKLENFDLTFTGFSDKEINTLFKDDGNAEIKGINMKEFFEVVIECQDEEEQERVFNKLTEEGYKCRVLTL